MMMVMTIMTTTVMMLMAMMTMMIMMMMMMMTMTMTMMMTMTTAMVIMTMEMMMSMMMIMLMNMMMVLVITASGGSWNASIVAEVASWGNVKLEAYGLGSYIANATSAGDFPRVLLGIAVMSLFVTFFNRALWRPLYVFAERRLRLD